MDLTNAIVNDDVLFRKVLIYIIDDTMEGLVKAAKRDSRGLDHLINGVLRDYVKGRKDL